MQNPDFQLKKLITIDNNRNENYYAKTLFFLEKLNYIDHNTRRKSSESQIEGFYNKKPKLILETGGFLTNYIRWKAKRQIKKLVWVLKFLFKIKKLYEKRNTFRKNLRLRQSMLKCKTHFHSPKQSDSSYIKRDDFVQKNPQNQDQIIQSFKYHSPRSPKYEQSINLPSIILTPKEKFSVLSKLKIKIPKKQKTNKNIDNNDRQSLIYIMSRNSMNLISTSQNSISIFDKAYLNQIIYSPKRQLRLKKKK